MGLRDRFKVLNEITKRALPVGSVAMTENQMATSGQSNFGNRIGLPREGTQVPFGAGNPILPGNINPVTVDGKIPPRRWEYPVAVNINVNANRPVDFSTLRNSADSIDILRRCIEVLKSKVTGLEWDIVVGEDAAEHMVADQGGTKVQAMAKIREQFTNEIDRARQFWEQPDPSNGLLFTDWLNMALEEVLVIDAWAVWPQTTVGGDLVGLQILDGSTIKPLIDNRGMRPLAPYPAFQQVLYGAPRSEFAASSAPDDASTEFNASELSYMIRNRRTNSLYGNPPVERALPVADLYLRRQMWLRAEYTDGVTPELMMKTDATFGQQPDLLRRFEDVFNADLAGQLEQRKRVRLIPAGMEPIQFEGYGERFKETFDEYLVTSICGHFGVQPSEIGFTPKGGLGGSGHQKGQAESAEVIGAKPLASWIARMITDLSYTYLEMPKELEFRFLEMTRENRLEKAQAEQIELQNGGTLNELRSEKGLSLVESPEADMPIIVIGMNAYFITPNGAVPFADSGMMDENGVVNKPDPVVVANPAKAIAAPNEEEPDEASVKEMKTFLKWVKKAPTREFNFEHTSKIYADVLNKFVIAGDLDAARWYAENYLS